MNKFSHKNYLILLVLKKKFCTYIKALDLNTDGKIEFNEIVSQVMEKVSVVERQVRSAPVMRDPALIEDENY